MRILVADDERWIRKGIIKMIQDGKPCKDLELLEADTVEGAFDLFLEKRPEIVVSDVKFPVEDGCTLCERIYGEEKKTKIVMISGYNEFDYVKRALSYKAVDYLLKPVDKKVLNQTIFRCVEELLLNPQDTETGQNTRQKAAGRRQSMDIQEVVRLITEEIQQNCQGRYTLTELASRYHLSEAYLSTTFKKLTGQSLMTYIMQIKVLKAQELMLTTNWKMWDIAAQVGYPDQHYFTKVFKKVTGESPTEYKSRLEKELYRE